MTGHHFLESKEWCAFVCSSNVLRCLHHSKIGKMPRHCAGHGRSTTNVPILGERWWNCLMSFRIYQCQDQSISVANTLYNFVSLSSATYSHVLLITIPVQVILCVTTCRPKHPACHRKPRHHSRCQARVYTREDMWKQLHTLAEIFSDAWQWRWIYCV